MVVDREEVSDVVTAVEAIQRAQAQGKEIESITPLNDGRSGWEVVFSDATGISFKSSGDHGVVPYFTIGSDSCWFESRDALESFERLYDSDLHPVVSEDGKNTASEVLKAYAHLDQSDRTALVKAIAEDNNSLEVILTMGDGVQYAFKRADNILKSFAFRAVDNPNEYFEDVVYCIGGNRLVAYTPYVINRSNLVASFTASPRSSVSVNGQYQMSGSSANDFNTPVTYRLTSADKAENVYTVIIQQTGLPVVYIQTPDAAPIVSKEDWMENASIKIVYPTGTVDYENDKLQIRGRGNTTWEKFPKKPYALKLDKKAEILGMPKHKRWVLLANWQDRTLMRNDVAFQISKLTDLDWTPRGYFVEVVLNGKHQGNYYLCEQIKVDENRVNVAEMTSADIEGDAITGGYLMEVDEYYDEVNKFMSDLDGPWMFKDPDEDVLTPEQFAYFRNFIAELESTLVDEEKFAKREYLNYIDLDSFIDYWLVEELTGNFEPNYPKSSYFHKDRLGKLKAGPVWDFDWSTFFPEHVNKYRSNNSLYYSWIFRDPEVLKQIKVRWTKLKPGFETVPNYVRNMANSIRTSESLNIALWPIDTSYNGDEDLTFQEAVDRMIKAYVDKMNWLDAQISEF